MMDITLEHIEKIWNESVDQKRYHFEKISEAMRGRIENYSLALIEHLSPKKDSVEWENIEQGDTVELTDNSGDTYILKVKDILLEEGIIVAGTRSFEFEEIVEKKLVIYPMDPLPTEIGSVIAITEINEEKLDNPVIASFHGDRWIDFRGETVETETITRWADPKFAFINKAGKTVEITQETEEIHEQEPSIETEEISEDGENTRALEEESHSTITPVSMVGNTQPVPLESEDIYDNDPAESEAVNSQDSEINAWNEVIEIRGDDTPTEPIQTEESVEEYGEDSLPEADSFTDESPTEPLHINGEDRILILERDRATLRSFLNLEYGWNDGSGREISEKAVQTAEDILEKLSDMEVYHEIRPMEDGGLFIRWNDGLDRTLTIIVSMFGVCSVTEQKWNTPEGSGNYEILSQWDAVFDTKRVDEIARDSLATFPGAVRSH